MATRRTAPSTATSSDATARVINLTSPEINEVLEVCLATPMDGYPGADDCLWGMPLLIEGEPGIAKTARVKQTAKSLDAHLEIIYAAQHPPEDFSGALIPTGNGGANQICPLPQVRKLVVEKSGILFLDEVNGAPPATQGALMSLIHERRAGDADIPGRVRILAAANPEEIATGGFRLAPALANRFIHITDPGPTGREWTAWLMGSSASRLQQSLNQIEKVIIADWPDIYPEVQGLFSGFIERFPDLMHKRPDSSDEQSGKAWPSHRTWDYATRVCAAARIMEKNDTIRDALIEACVGPGAAQSLAVYQREANIPKPLDVLNGKWKPDPHRLDIILAAYTAAIAYVRQRPTRAEKMQLAPLAWECMAPLLEGLTDIIVPAVTGLIQEKLGRQSGDEAIKKAANKILVPLAQTGVAKFLEERP